MLFPPTFTLATLIERYAEHSGQKSGDVAAALCSAVRDLKLPVTGRFPGEPSPLLTGLSELPLSARGHVREVAEGLTRPDSRFDLGHIFVERSAFRLWLESEGFNLPSFWFESPGASTLPNHISPTKRSNDKRKTIERNARIIKAAKELGDDALRQGKRLNKVQVSKALAAGEKGESLEPASIRRILAAK